MAFLKKKDISTYVLKELQFRLPKKIILDSMRLAYNPKIFKEEYRDRQHDVDKYFMHLSEASEGSIYQLTVEMSSYDATVELELISAKVLLALQEFSSMDEKFEIHCYKPDEVSWMSYFYYNQGGLIKFLHGWK